MNRPIGLFVVMSLLLLLMISCAAQFTFLAPATLSEAIDLKNICTQRKLSDGELKTADSLFTNGTLLLKKGKNESAYLQFDRAIIHYRIVLTKESILLKEREIEKQKQMLSKTREDVSAYNQALNELKTMEQK